MLRYDGQSPRVAVVHRPKYDDWSLPKGKREPGEKLVTTAVREVEEETGMRVALRRQLPARHYLVDGSPKVVHYWVGEVQSDPDRFIANAEVDDLRWLRPEDAKALLTQPHDAELIDAATKAPAGIPLLVIRHAKAVARRDWHDSDRSRPLSKSGRADAVGLIALLAAFGVRRILASPATRCVQTLAPFAESCGLSVQQEPLFEESVSDGDPDATGRRFDDIVDGLPLGTALCTHRRTFPIIASRLGGRSTHSTLSPVPPFADAVPTAAVWAVFVADGNVVDQQYLPRSGDN